MVWRVGPTGWEILDEESLSLLKYIKLSLEEQCSRASASGRRRLVIGRAKFIAALQTAGDLKLESARDLDKVGPTLWNVLR